MITEAILSQSVRGDLVVPRFLGAEDASWLISLIEEFARFDGRPRRELLLRLKEPFPFAALPGKLALATQALKQMVWNESRPLPLRPRLVRQALFTAAHACGSRETALTDVANAFASPPDELIQQLFSDLGSERAVHTSILDGLAPTDLALMANLMLVKSLLGRSREVCLRLSGQCHAVIRQAKLRGLICVIDKKDDTDGFQLTLSGPYALFRHTLVYGRHLGELIPLLQRCDKYELEAVCVIKGRARMLRLSSGAPIAPSYLGKRFDSQVERRFSRDFTKLALDWDLIREPEPIVFNHRWMFPDFEIRHRKFPERRWYLEVVGYWRPDYLREKFAKIQDAAIANFIICIDKKNACGELTDWGSTGAHVIEYSKLINPKNVLEFIQRSENTHLRDL